MSIFKKILNKDDIVLVQANIAYLIHKYKVKPIDILHSILDSCDTAVFPTFNVDNVRGNSYGHFDINETPSKMGVLSETARELSAIRSGHPIYSFVAIGSMAKEFNVNHFSGYGEDSPFDILHKVNGKIMVIGLPNSQGNTFFHHIEEMNQVPYRFYKTFTGDYTDWCGNTGERTYTFYCNGGVKTLLDPIDDLMWKAGLYKGDKPFEGHGIRVIEAGRMYKFVENIIKQGKAKGLLYDRAKCN